MGRRRAHPPLNIFINNRLAGRLLKQASGAIEFRYDQSWLAWEHAFPISLSLPLRESQFTGEPVVAVFDNLLPDNAAVRRRVRGVIRGLIQIVFGLSIAFAASSFFLSFFSFGGGALIA